MYVEQDFSGKIAIHDLSASEAELLTNALRYSLNNNNMSLNNKQFVRLLEDLIHKTLKEL